MACGVWRAILPAAEKKDESDFHRRVLYIFYFLTVRLDTE